MMTPEQRKKIRDAMKTGSSALIDEVIRELCEPCRTVEPAEAPKQEVRSNAKD